MNRVAAAGAALLLLLSLTGCIRWWHEDDVAEGPLRERIGELESVVEVASTVDHMFGITSYYVWVTVSDLIESDLQAIVANADEVLAGRDVTFDIRFDGVRLLSIGYPHDFSSEQLANEVHYWLALSEANSDPLGMDIHNSSDGPYRNIWDPDKTDLVDWEALRAVPDASAASRSYYLDGIVARTALPTPDVLALRDRLVALEVGDAETVELDYFAPGYVMVRYFSPEAGSSDPAAMRSWPHVLEIVSEMAALGLPQSDFVFSTDDFGDGASVHLGACAELEDGDPDWASAELAAALASSGIALPGGVGSETCNDVFD